MESSNLIHYLFIYLFSRQVLKPPLCTTTMVLPLSLFFSFSFFEVQIFQKICHIIFFWKFTTVVYIYSVLGGYKLTNFAPKKFLINKINKIKCSHDDAVMGFFLFFAPFSCHTCIPMYPFVAFELWTHTYIHTYIHPGIPLSQKFLNVFLGRTFKGNFVLCIKLSSSKSRDL